MVWKFLKKGLWVWLSKERYRVMLVMGLAQEPEWRCWVMKFSGFRCYAKTHDKAFKAFEIVRSHLHDAAQEITEQKLLIPTKNVGLGIEFAAQNQLEQLYYDFYGSMKEYPSDVDMAHVKDLVETRRF